jgi:hypothetical protein
MKKILLLGIVVAAMGCARVKLVLINTTDRPIKNVEIKLDKQVTQVPEIPAGGSHEEALKIEQPVSINVNYQDPEGRQYYSSSPQQLNPGDGGSLRLSVTAKGTLEAVRLK